jgi:cysteine desulfuration protein SufE
MLNVNIQSKVDEWSQRLSMLSGMDRLEYIFGLAQLLEPVPENFKQDQFLIPGCVSKLWLIPKYETHTLTLMADAEAQITKGITHIVLDILGNQSYEGLRDVELKDFTDLGISQLLTPQRQNGLGSLILTIKHYAELNANSCHNKQNAL